MKSLISFLFVSFFCTSFLFAADKSTKLKKRVHFHASVKKHDGLSPESRFLDEISHEFFNCPENRYKTLDLLVKEKRVKILKTVYDKINKTIFRCFSLGEGENTAVLIHGGGRRNIVDRRFALWFLKLKDKIHEKILFLEPAEEENLEANVDEVEL